MNLVRVGNDQHPIILVKLLQKRFRQKGPAFEHESFRSADPVSLSDEKTVTVFNISGNQYRLITAIHYNTRRVYVLLFMTHAEYSKDRWKATL